MTHNPECASKGEGPCVTSQYVVGLGRENFSGGPRVVRGPLGVWVPEPKGKGGFERGGGGGQLKEGWVAVTTPNGGD